ncbi:NAD-dependent deacylase [bacterium]|nr:NAD-dependent deacylase [bacterium]
MKRLIAGARRVTVLTGFGMSPESDVLVTGGKCGPSTSGDFERDPRSIWELYNDKRSKFSTVAPNTAHFALAKLEKIIPNFILITQNIDSLHRLAGSKNIIELHGNIWKLRCTSCWKISDNYDVPLQLLPYCKDCGALLRPHVLWADELADIGVVSLARSALKCDVFVVVEISIEDQVSQKFILEAKSHGAKIAVINADILSQLV